MGLRHGNDRAQAQARHLQGRQATRLRDELEHALLADVTQGRMAERTGRAGQGPRGARSCTHVGVVGPQGHAGRRRRHQQRAAIVTDQGQVVASRHQPRRLIVNATEHLLQGDGVDGVEQGHGVGGISLLLALAVFQGSMAQHGQGGVVSPGQLVRGPAAADLKGGRELFIAIKQMQRTGRFSPAHGRAASLHQHGQQAIGPRGQGQASVIGSQAAAKHDQAGGVRVRGEWVEMRAFVGVDCHALPGQRRALRAGQCATRTIEGPHATTGPSRQCARCKAGCVELLRQSAFTPVDQPERFAAGQVEHAIVAQGHGSDGGDLVGQDHTDRIGGVQHAMCIPQRRTHADQHLAVPPQERTLRIKGRTHRAGTARQWHQRARRQAAAQAQGAMAGRVQRAALPHHGRAVLRGGIQRPVHGIVQAPMAASVDVHGQ